MSNKTFGEWLNEVRGTSVSSSIIDYVISQLGSKLINSGQKRLIIVEIKKYIDVSVNPYLVYDIITGATKSLPEDLVSTLLFGYETINNAYPNIDKLLPYVFVYNKLLAKMGLTPETCDYFLSGIITETQVVQYNKTWDSLGLI